MVAHATDALSVSPFTRLKAERRTDALGSKEEEDIQGCHKGGSCSTGQCSSLTRGPVYARDGVPDVPNTSPCSTVTCSTARCHQNHGTSKAYDGSCPSCQMPFRVLLLETPQCHVEECLMKTSNIKTGKATDICT